ncbi:MAG: thiamine pyrophosphate-dependent dehydrogenase E1 component subunit alpha [Gammaproteobacteria bacterium]|nr:thiamine pyrophosphate-dependent dehydrogenase E1 component subunit alpha [Gammaproteobacteria bacterium]
MILDKKTLLDAYRRLKTIREFELRMRAENEAGQLPGFLHLYCGQEAIAVGACMQLDEKDYIGSTHRGHGHCIAKGCDVGDMLLEIYCKQGGLCNGKGGSMHIADMNKGMLGANAIVGAAPPIAVGAALTAKTLKTGGVAMAFIGDGASNQGTVFEALNLASVLKLPMIFIYENNGYGEFTGAGYHVGGNDIVGRARAFGMPGENVDGTDFFAMFEAVGEAVQRARRGDGPSAIEASAMRYYGHFEGDPQLYRAKNEVKNLMENADPVRNFVTRVTDSGELTVDELAVIDTEILAMLDEKVEAARAAPVPAANELYTDVYANY